jgi:hypothetical protein
MKIFFLSLTLVLLVVSTLSAQGLSKSQLKKMNKASSSLFQGQCPLERVNWMEVTEGYDSNTIIALAAEIQAAAKADAGKIAKIADGNASGKVTSDFNKTIEKISQKKVKVSQEFYEQYLMMRAPICNIYTSVQQGFYKDNPDGLKAAQAKFTEMNDSWLKYAQDEQKKSPH